MWFNKLPCDIYIYTSSSYTSNFFQIVVNVISFCNLIITATSGWWKSTTFHIIIQVPFYEDIEPGKEATHNQPKPQWMTIYTCDAPGVQGICVPMMSSSNLEGWVKLSMATPPSSMSPVVSFRWEVTGCEEVTSLDRDDGRGKESQKGHCNHSVSNWTF